MSIDLDEQTAQQLLQAASSQGMDVSEYVRSHLLPTNIKVKAPSSIIGAMADEVLLLDEVFEEAMTAREK